MEEDQENADHAQRCQLQRDTLKHIEGQCHQNDGKCQPHTQYRGIKPGKIRDHARFGIRSLKLGISLSRCGIAAGTRDEDRFECRHDPFGIADREGQSHQATIGI